MSLCFHCGLPAVAGYTATIDGRREEFCCIACQTVASAIANDGLVDFYRYRDKKNNKADIPNTKFDAYDLAELQSEFVFPIDNNTNDVQLSIAGISCAACAWLIENRLSMLNSVKEVSVNASNYRCRIVWDASRSPLSDIFKTLAEIGFSASPYTESNLQAQRKRESKKAMMRLGVAGIGMMQVGMYAIALHAGAMQGMDDQWRVFLRYISLIVATPVVLYSAQSFFINAWRSLSHLKLTMDVPVALAIGLAYLASVWATVTKNGEVYFDSISMFTFFLLLGRYVEMKVRHSSAFASERMSQLLPITVDVMNGEHIESVPLKGVEIGQKIRVSAGATIPCDGEVIEGKSSVNESLLSGESNPVIKHTGDKVSAGTNNGESPLTLRVDAIGNNTRLASIERMVDKASIDKPKIVSLADRIASKFVFFVLVSASAVGGYWYLNDPEQALWIVLSVLVATCPCALSLATPAAVTAGVNALRRFGLLVSSPHFIEKMPQINCVAFDKTGTLTEGKLAIKDMVVVDEYANDGYENKDALISLIAAMELGSKHPIASAFSNIVPQADVKNINVVAGLGVSAEFDEDEYRFGTAAFASPNAAVEYPSDGLWCLLSKNQSAYAWILLEDSPRAHVAELIDYLKRSNIELEIISGDRQANVEQFAKAFGLKYSAEQLPEHKLSRIQELQKEGKKILMLGDGINDVPVLSAADLSIAVGDATKLAQTHADAVLTSGSLLRIIDVHQLSRTIQSKIKQNLSWAFLYNLSILPAAAMGYVPPWLAAIGMSLSSLLVVLNSLTIQFYKPKLV